MVKKRDNFYLESILAALIIVIGVGLVYLTIFSPVQGPPAKATEAVEYLAEAPPDPSGFRLRDVPAWLFIHVGAIAICQAASLIYAARIAQRQLVRRQDLKTVQFLCEIPMYLGLFGTLLGVCLTQFITGTLVAPLAYLTTMSGIVLHVLGKLAIWLPLTGAGENEEE